MLARIAVLVAACAASASAFGLTHAVRAEPAVHALNQRSFIGGWALGAGFSGSCPTSTTECNKSGTCCPSDSVCAPQGNFDGVACCPSSSV